MCDWFGWEIEEGVVSGGGGGRKMASGGRLKVKPLTVSDVKKLSWFMAKAAVVLYVLYMVLVVATRKHWNGVRMPFYKLQVQTLKYGDDTLIMPGDKVALNISSFNPYTGKKVDLMEITYRVGSCNLFRAIDVGMLGWNEDPLIDIPRMKNGETRRILAPKKYCFGGTPYKVEEPLLNKTETRQRFMGRRFFANVYELTAERLVEERLCDVKEGLVTGCVNKTRVDTDNSKSEGSDSRYSRYI